MTRREFIFGFALSVLLTVIFILASSAIGQGQIPPPDAELSKGKAKVFQSVDYMEWEVTLSMEGYAERRVFTTACWRPTNTIRWCGYRWKSSRFPRQKLCFWELFDGVKTRLCVRVIPV